MFERFASEARSAVVHSVEESRLRGDRRVGTDHLLLGALHDPAVAAALGVDLEAAREASAGLDGAALRAVGIDVDVEGWTPIPKLRRAPYSSGSREVMRAMLTRATSEGARAIALRHLALAILDRRAPDPASALLDALHVDRDRARKALSPSMAA